MIEEVLEERVISSRGRSVKRGVRQRLDHYKTRQWGPTNTVKNIDYEKAVVVQGQSQFLPSLLPEDINQEDAVLAK